MPIQGMLSRIVRYLFSVVITIATANAAKAQAGLCPSNLDFEQGDFTGWVCEAGNVNGSGIVNTTPTLPIPGRHTIISAATAGTDPYGGFPMLCPNGSGYSVKLGNNGGGNQAESISYTYSIPSTLTVFSMLFHYAVVLQDPNHLPHQQPRFRARITDLSGGLPIPCVDFDFTASASLPGFLPSSMGGGVIYKDWTPITINLTAYIGKTIKLEFITNDCTFTAHFGYAYLDVNTNCNGSISGTNICQGETSINLTAPYGFQSYEWYSNNTFTTLVSTSQNLLLNPAPSVGTVIPVIVTPYSGFGCRDTLYATIGVAPKPVSVAGPDITGCSQQQVQIGGPSTAGYNYTWTPASQVSNPNISNPFAWNTPPTPTQFIVTTTDLLTGCSSTDTTIVNSISIDTTLMLTGKNIYCSGDPAAGILSVQSGPTEIQWYNGTTPIPGATSVTYQPTTTGSFWAQLQLAGCTDSTRIELFTINPVPVSNAGPNANICLNQTIQLGAAANPLYTYLWTPAALLNNATIADPIASFTNTTPVQFIVHTIDAVTGCNSYDTTLITPRATDTAIVLSGKKDYCFGDPAAGSLSVKNVLTAVQWYEGITPIPGATGFTFTPTTAGNYWAQVQQSGCTDSTATIPFGIHAVPRASFTASSDTGCFTNHNFAFTNTSLVTDGSALSYLWRFGDGSTQTVTDPTKTFLTPGTHFVKLITSTSFGCIDSTNNYIVRVFPNAETAFKWDSICVNNPIQFYNQTNTNGSVQVNYNWNFNNGNPPVSIKDPLPVIFTTVGATDVTLIATALGCENFPSSLTHKVAVHQQVPGTRYRDITVPQGSSKFIHARGDVGTIYSWTPTIQLSTSSKQYTEFTAVDDVLYHIEIINKYSCRTTDTLQMLVLKKPGYYLPTAFTPNGDGLNDVVKPYLVGMKSLKSFSIFNRWGNLVFYTTKYGEGWDGKYKGITQNAGVYVWILEFIDDRDKKISEKGTLTIVR